ncbi:Hypothetical predicted protein [Mytilus galloprovincialis]|uniref:Uncharacterized protein n=1 Tax=Mytilus galloprovincialis TaxID=29158 RepID=A0A8B6CDB7_MYTGA|nr:Hypothetical predicted protein [Mytilus galloprovincialis]
MVFMSVYIEKYSTRAQELLKYMRDIRLAATRSENWATYDEQFRLKIEKESKFILGKYTRFFGIASELHVGLENVVSGNGGVYRWVTLGPPPPHLIEGRPTPANRWGTNNWSIGNTSVFPGHSPWHLFDVFDWNIMVTSIQAGPS